MTTVPGPSAGEAAQKMRDAAKDAGRLADEFKDGAGELGAALRAEVDTHPIRAVLIAAGVGYVLGGGLASRLTLRLARIALRTLILPALSAPLTSVMHAVTGAMSEETGPRGPGMSQPS